MLRGHKLVFYDHGQRWMGAVASIERSHDEEVWGCIWRVENSFAAELDKQENGYHRLSGTYLTILFPCSYSADQSCCIKKKEERMSTQRYSRCRLEKHC